MSHEHHISLQPCSFYHFASFMNRQLDHICMYELKQTRCRCIYMYVYYYAIQYLLFHFHVGFGISIVLCMF